MDESNASLDLSTLDLDSSVVFISDIDDSAFDATIKSTPGSKRKRDVITGIDELEKKEDAELVDIDNSSEENGDMEPKRKRPLVPDVVKDTNFDDNLPPTVTLLRTKNGGKVYLVGTAHFSLESQDDVAKVINTVKPKGVVVELCRARTDIIFYDEEAILAAAQDLNFQKISSIIKQNGAVNGILYLTLLQMSAYVTKQLGMAPGGEFRRALQEVSKQPGCTFFLGDRPINVTISRLFASLSWWQCGKFLWSVVWNKDPIKKEDVENAKKQDVLEAMLGEMSDEFPTMKEILVTERDIYLTHSLENASQCCPPNEPSRVVGVIGIGHVQGIKEHWGKVTEEDIERIMTIPAPSRVSKVVRISVRVALFGGLAYAAYRVVPFGRIAQMVRS